MSTKKEELEEYDICVCCGDPTPYNKTDNIVYRNGYIEGAGQLCVECSQIRKRLQLVNESLS
jgi:hypothetical protein